MIAQPDSSGYKRKLLAILYADVNEFSRMMMAGELRAVQQLNSYRSIVDEITKTHLGRTVGASGDSIIAEFQSAVDAVICAVEIQKELHDRNLNLPAFRRMEFRIAVNVGEVLADQSSIYGDGVNVAARLQKLARPGGICISGVVHETVKGKLTLDFVFLGQQTLKNIIDPVAAYRIHLPHEPVHDSPGIKSDLHHHHHVSIAVLPLDNLSDNRVFNSAVDVLGDGVSAALSKFREVSVVAKESAFLFKGDNKLLQQVSLDLNIGYVFSGSIRQVEQTARVILHLLDARTAQVIWGDEFSRSIEELYRSLDELVKTVVSTIIVLVEKIEQGRANTLDTANVSSYHLLLKGQRFSRQYTAQSNLAARKLYEAAIRMDPNYARAYAELSRTHNFDWRYSWSDSPSRSLETALVFAQKAVEVDELSAHSLAELGFVYLFMKEHDMAISQYERALVLNPNDTEAMADMADALAYAGRGEEAIDLLQTSLRLNPYDPDWRLWSLGDTYYMIRDYEAVIRTLKKMRDPAESHRLLAACYAHLGMREEASKHAAEVRHRQPDFSAEDWAAMQPELNPDEAMHYLEGLKKAGL
ncbi:adenylate/guanylate cyclase domain-containing protein [Gammaproteobacteria bacterium]|nr:adenylate/guanylate cyclase domain-containing protein [Gammaproteobacteria bacterium]